METDVSLKDQEHFLCMQERTGSVYLNEVWEVCCYLFIIVSGVRLSPLGTAVTTGLLYQPQMIDDGDCGEIGGMNIGRGNRSTRRKPGPVPLCPPQIPHDQTRARTRAAALGSQRLTAWATARPQRCAILCLHHLWGWSSSGSDVHHYFTVTGLYSQIRWEPKSLCWRSRWTNRDFCSVRLPTQGVTYPQRCYRQSITALWYSTRSYTIFCFPVHVVDVHIVFCFFLYFVQVENSCESGRMWKEAVMTYFSQSQSHIATDGQSVSLGVEPHLGLMARYLLLFDSYGLCFCGAPSLTRGRVCLLYILLALLARAVFLGSESLETRVHILLSKIWDFPLRRLLRLAGSRWRYSIPPPHGLRYLRYINISDIRLILFRSVSLIYSRGGPNGKRRLSTIRMGVYHSFAWKWTSYCWTVCFCGNVFTKPLPSNRSICLNIYIYVYVFVYVSVFSFVSVGMYLRSLSCGNVFV
jgi:hypothetical protein